MTEGSGGTSGSHGGSEDQTPERRRRLDPDRAAAARRAVRHPTPQVLDTRRYQRMIGIFGLTLVAIVAITFLVSGHRPGTAGIPAGKSLPEFAAPLAASTLNGAANLHPHCTLAQHDPRALNVCLMIKHAPLVLAFFVTSSGGCEQEVTALQNVSHELPPGEVQFAAVAVSTDHQDAARAVRSHHWTIPVGYDVDGRVGAAYGVEVCPIVELVRRGGVVANRLIGEHWTSSAALAPQVRRLVAGQ